MARSKAQRRKNRAARAQASSHRHDRTTHDPRLSSADRDILTQARMEMLFTAAATAGRHGADLLASETVADLVGLGIGGSERLLARTVTGQVRPAMTEAWGRGWQPQDVHEHLSRDADPMLATLAADAMADELATYPRARIDERWLTQLDALDATTWWPGDSSWVRARVDSGLGWQRVVAAAAGLLARLQTLPRVERFTPLPGQATPTVRPGRTDAKMLAKVRQLLAKAESTTFEAEADALTAAAQRLMSRHSIDQAMLSAHGVQSLGDAPAGRRIWVARPYVQEKVLLLQAVGDANRARTVWLRELEAVTVLGFDADLDAVETLYTSLLVQATRALQAEGSRITAWGRSRTRGFRQSFLAAFAARIGERLRQAAEEETEAAAADVARTTGSSLVPVLADRRERLEAYTTQLYPHVVVHQVSGGRDHEGWVKGRQAADRAQLRWGNAIEG